MMVHPYLAAILGALGHPAFQPPPVFQPPVGAGVMVNHLDPRGRGPYSGPPPGFALAGLHNRQPPPVVIPEQGMGGQVGFAPGDPRGGLNVQKPIPLGGIDPRGRGPYS